MQVPAQNRVNAQLPLPRQLCRGKRVLRSSFEERFWLRELGIPPTELRCSRRAWAPSVHCWQHGGAALLETYQPVLLELSRPEWGLAWQLTREGMSVDQAVNYARALTG